MSARRFVWAAPRRALLTMMVAIPTLAACTGAREDARDGATVGAITVHHVVAPAPIAVGAPDSATMAAYATIANAGAEGDSLIAVASPVAREASIHSQMDHGGMAMMHPVAAVAIPARGEARLAPGGMHIMLTGLGRLPVAGDSVPLVLTFAHAGRLEVVARVVSYDQLEGALMRPAGR